MEYMTIISISLVLVLLRIIYSCLKQPFSYWEKLGVPFVPGAPIVGSMLESLTGKLHDVDVRWAKKYGNLYGYYENSRPTLNVSDPALLRDIFVKDFQVFSNRRDFGAWDPLTRDMVSVVKGEPWKRLRSVMSPAFTTGKIKRIFSIMVNSAEQLCRNITPLVRSGKPIDAKRIFGTFTLDVISSSAFGTKLDSHNDPDNPFVTAAKNAFNPKYPWRFVGLFLFPGIMKFFRIAVFDPKSTSFFKDVTIKIIEERKRTGKKYNDFLQLMLEASETAQDKQDAEEEDQTLKDIGHEEENQNVFKISNVKDLTENQIIANSIIFFLAGYDTTASTLSFATYFMAINPSCQEKLITEIDGCIRQQQNQLNYEAVQNMKYLDMVISETLRIYPPAIRTDRVAEEDYKLGNTGITIQSGHIVSVSIYAIHHDPANYPEPDKFDPLRFTTEEKAKRDTYTYMPFGAGPRNCLGMRFALIEVKICLAYLFSQFRAKRSPRTMVPLKFKSGQGLLQPKEVVFELEERTDRVYKP